MKGLLYLSAKNFMKLKRPNKKLEEEIKKAVKGMLCPIHRKEAEVTMESETEPCEVKACCAFFKNDITVIAERIRKDFVYRDMKTRERLEKERRKGNRSTED